MKEIAQRILCILAGAIIIGVSGNYIIDWVARWYGPRYIQSDQDIGIAYLYSLVALVIFIVAGAFVGNALFKNLIRRSTGRAKAARR